jgi:hypothetical protein
MAVTAVPSVNVRSWGSRSAFNECICDFENRAATAMFLPRDLCVSGRTPRRSW